MNKLSDQAFRSKAKAIAREILNSEVEQIGDTGEGGDASFAVRGVVGIGLTVELITKKTVS